MRSVREAYHKQTKWFKALCEGDAKAWATAWELANSKLRFQMRGWEGVTNGFIVLSTRAKNLSSPPYLPNLVGAVRIRWSVF